MRLLVRTTLILTVVGSLLALGLSIWPGVLALLFIISIFLSIVLFPVFLIASVVAGIALYRRHKQGKLSPLPIKEAAAIPVVVLATLVLLIFYVPRRIAFLSSRSAFEEIADKASNSTDHEFSNARLGIYEIDSCRSDARGGVYFRAFSHGDGPDTMSYGFVKQPNQEGSPFGAAGFKVFHLVDDWYWFRASDDYW